MCVATTVVTITFCLFRKGNFKFVLKTTSSRKNRFLDSGLPVFRSPGREKKVRWAAGWRWVDIFVHIHRVFATLRATSVDISLVRTGRVQLCLCTKASKKKLPYLAVSFISTGGYTSATTRISTWVDIHR